MTVMSDELQLFALLLGAPEPESLVVLEAMAEGHPWLAAPLAELKHLPLDKWQGEHTALFVSGYPHTIAPPFISALRHGQMGGGVEEALIDFYQRLGLQPDEMPADYLGTLFECAAWLQSQPDRAAEWEALWQEYLLPALPDFSRRLIEHSGLQLYRAMGKRLEEICNERA